MFKKKAWLTTQSLAQHKTFIHSSTYLQPIPAKYKPHSHFNVGWKWMRETCADFSLYLMRYTVTILCGSCVVLVESSWPFSLLLSLSPQSLEPSPAQTEMTWLLAAPFWPSYNSVQLTDGWKKKKKKPREKNKPTRRANAKVTHIQVQNWKEKKRCPLNIHWSYKACCTWSF